MSLLWQRWTRAGGVVVYVEGAAPLLVARGEQLEPVDAPPLGLALSALSIHYRHGDVLTPEDPVTGWQEFTSPDVAGEEVEV